MRKLVAGLIGVVAVLNAGCTPADAMKRMREEAAQHRAPSSRVDRAEQDRATPTGSVSVSGATDLGGQPLPGGRIVTLQVKALPAGVRAGDARGPLPGVPSAAVWIRGLEMTSSTDADGNVRIPIPTGEQTLVVSPREGQNLQQSTYRLTITDGGPDMYTVLVSPDGERYVDHGQEGVPPAFNPEPERVSEIRELGERGRAGHPFLGKQASLWRDGEVQVEGLFEPFFVGTARSDESVISTDGGVRGKWFAQYRSPQPIGQLTITGIDQTGMIVSFRSATGIGGTFDLHTHHWEFVPGP